MPGLIQPHPVELVVSHKSIFSRKLLETEFLASNFPPPRKAVVPSSDETKLTAFLWRNYRSTPLTNSNLIERKPMRGKELSPLFSLNGLDRTPSLATRNFNISTLQVKLRPPSRGRILFLFVSTHPRFRSFERYEIPGIDLFEEILKDGLLVIFVLFFGGRERIEREI